MHMVPTSQDAALFLRRKGLRQSLYLSSTNEDADANASSSKSNSNPIKTSPSRKSMTKSKSKSFVVPPNFRQSSIPLSPARYMMLASASSSKNHNFMSISSQNQKMNKMLKVNVDQLHNHPTRKKSKSSHKNKGQDRINNLEIHHPVVLCSKSLCSTTQNEIQIAPINKSNDNNYQNIQIEQDYQSQRINQHKSMNSIVLHAHKTTSRLKSDQSSLPIPKTRNNAKNSKLQLQNENSLTIQNNNNNNNTVKHSNVPCISTPSPRKGILKPPKQPTYPVFHNFPLCTAQPGTQNWNEYWKEYDQKLAEYKKTEQEYLEEHHEYRADLEKYKQEAARLQEVDTMFRQSIGLEQKKASEILNHQLTGLTTVNGFVFDRNGGPSDGLNAFLSSVGTTGFRLEIDVRAYNKDSIKIDKEYNLMKIQIPVDPQKSRHKTIVIGVPSDHDLNDVEIYPIVNGWLVVEMSPDKTKNNNNIPNTSLS